MKNSNSRRVVVIEPKASDFMKWTKLQSQSKIKSHSKLSGMKVVRFLRGSSLLYYKLSHSENEFQQMDFLKKTTNIKVTPEPICLNPRVISAEKKCNIIAKLCKYMPASRKRFWEEIEEAEDV